MPRKDFSQVALDVVCRAARKTPKEPLKPQKGTERANLSICIGMRRFTRLTNAFSRMMENHMQAVIFYFMVYNFVKIHKSIKTTPVVQAGVIDYLWSMEDIVMMSDTAG